MHPEEPDMDEAAGRKDLADIRLGIEANLSGKQRDTRQSDVWLLGWDEAEKERTRPGIVAEP